MNNEWCEPLDIPQEKFVKSGESYKMELGKAKCPYCGCKKLELRPATQFPNQKDKTDAWCKKCGYIYTGTVVKVKL